MDQDTKSLSEQHSPAVDADASARRTLVLGGTGDSTPAPTQFRQNPLVTGACEYDWSARVDRLTRRLDKLQLRVEALENSFADPDSISTDPRFELRDTNRQHQMNSDRQS